MSESGNDAMGVAAVKQPWLDKQALTRVLLGALGIVAVFFLFEKERPFTQVYKPLGLFLVLMVPAQIMLTRLRSKRSA